MRTDTPQTIHLKDYQPSPYLIDTVDLTFALDPSRTRVRSILNLRPNPKWSGNERVLQLDGEQLELVAIKLNGNSLGDGD